MKKENKASAAFSLKEDLEPVSELTTNRLSVYLRCLNALDEAGVKTISSQALAEQFHLNAAQIRKDLAYFGEFGVRGVGYYVKELRTHLRQILGLDRRVKVAIMGAGNLGWRSPITPASATKGSRLPRCSTASARRLASARAAACPSTTSAPSGGWCARNGSPSP